MQRKFENLKIRKCENECKRTKMIDEPLTIHHSPFTIAMNHEQSAMNSNNPTS